MLRLRAATRDDIPLLEEWNRRPHVIRATTDDPDATSAEDDWPESLDLAEELGPDVWQMLVAELDGRPIGVVQIIDPHREPTHYWGTIEPNLRAIDIWIGEEHLLGQGHGTKMMRQAIERCFASPEVSAIMIDPLISNRRAIRFYRRLGFKDVGPRRFNKEGGYGDDCLVMRLGRSR